MLVGAYALGKAQRVIAELRRAGHHDADLAARRDGADVPALRGVRRRRSASCGWSRDATKDELRGAIVICPPSALNDRWSRRLPDPITAMASGLDARAPARPPAHVELPLVISDHADWDELTRTIEEVNPAESWITHGREEALLRWCQLHQRRARALALVGYEDEDD